MDKICRGILSYRQKWKDTMVQQFKEVGTCVFKTKVLCKKKPRFEKNYQNWDENFIL